MGEVVVTPVILHATYVCPCDECVAKRTPPPPPKEPKKKLCGFGVKKVTVNHVMVTIRKELYDHLSEACEKNEQWKAKNGFIIKADYPGRTWYSEFKFKAKMKLYLPRSVWCDKRVNLNTVKMTAATGEKDRAALLSDKYLTLFKEALQQAAQEVRDKPISEEKDIFEGLTEL